MAAGGGVAQAGAAVEGAAPPLPLHQLGLAGVDPDTHRQATNFTPVGGGDPGLDGQGGPHRRDRAREHGMHRVAHRLEHLAALSPHDVADQLIVARQHRRHAGGMVLPQAGAALDVGEHKSHQPSRQGHCPRACSAAPGRGFAAGLCDGGRLLVGGRGCLPVQLWFLQQDGFFEAAQRRARFDAQLVAQQTPEPTEGAQRFALAAGSIQRQHELRPQALPERMGADQAFQVPDQPLVIAERQSDLDPLLGAHQPQFIQSGRLASGELLEGELHQGRTPPQPQCRIKQRQGGGVVTRSPGCLRLAQQPFEAAGVDPLGRDIQDVTGRPGHDELSITTRWPARQQRPQAVHHLG